MAKRSKAPFEYEAGSKYGAQMGRRSTPLAELVGKVKLQRVKMYDGDYDKGGAYWGAPANVWCAANREGLLLFCRSSSRQAAKKTFMSRFPQLRWVN